MEFLGLNSSMGYNEETIVFMIQIQMLVSLYGVLGSEQ
jgi:hypothetical protein